MKTVHTLCSEEQMQLIRQFTHASRHEVLFTLKTARISAESILHYLKKLSSQRREYLQPKF